MRIIILLLLSFLFNSISISAPLPELIPRLYIFHVNGINTTLEEAVTNLEALEDLSEIDSDVLINRY